MSNILGGFLGTVWTSSGYDGGEAASNVGVITRLNPVVDPGNIEVEGTGFRGLYDLLLGMREPTLQLDLWPTDESFISSYQNGQSAIPFLHLKFTGGEGMTFVNAYANRMAVSANQGDALNLTAELWGAGDAGVTSATGLIEWDGSAPNQSWGPRETTPKKWSDTSLSLAGVTELTWWSWSYEVVNNLQRLGNVQTGGTRAVKARHRRVTGDIVMDLADYNEYADLVNVASDYSKFNVTVAVGVTDLLNNDDCRWGRIEAPTGPTDLIAKRFPFTAPDLTTLSP